jgi:hypothetical protein
MLTALFIVLVSAFGLGYTTRIIVTEMRALDAWLASRAEEEKPKIAPIVTVPTVTTVPAAMRTVKLTADSNKLAQLRTTVAKK